MVQTEDTKRTLSKLSVPELELMSATSTDYTSDASSAYFSEDDRKREMYIRSYDKKVFCLNMINMIVTVFLLAKDPKYFVYWNSVFIPALLINRAFDYYSKGWHFYMIDFCYIVNLLVIASTFFCPRNEIMFMISYGLSFGPLGFSIYYFRNTHALTSLDKITSLAIHNQAPLTMFLVHWHDKSGVFFTSANGLPEFGTAFLLKWYVGIIVFYGIWAIVYSSMIFLVFGEHISRKKLQTLYSYSMSDPKTAKKLLSRGIKWSKALFMFQHFRMALAFSTLAIVFYYSYWAALTWLLALNLVAIYNGATYLIDYHSTRYEKQFIYTSKRL